MAKNSDKFDLVRATLSENNISVLYNCRIYREENDIIIESRNVDGLFLGSNNLIEIPSKIYPSIGRIVLHIE